MNSAVPLENPDQSQTDGSKLTTMVNQQLNFLTRTDEPGYNVERSDILLTGVSIVMRLASLALTVMLSYQYYKTERLNYFALTLAALIVPAIITALLNLLMYLEDTRLKRCATLPCHGILLCVVLMPFLCRYWRSLQLSHACYRAKAQGNQLEQKRLYEQLVQEDNDVALLRIFECLLEVTTQKILQLTIVLSTGPIMLLQMLSIISAMGSIAWCMASHYRCVRFARPDKRHIPWSGTIVQIAWQFSVTVARVLAIATVASVFPLYTGLACCCHALLMALWIFFCERPCFCGDSTGQRLFLSSAFGLVYIFNYIPLHEGPTRLRYSLFYSLCFAETIACAVVYALFVRHPTIRQSAFCTVVLCGFPTATFMIGISLMLFFYTYCHPNITSRQQDTDVATE